MVYGNLGLYGIINMVLYMVFYGMILYGNIMVWYVKYRACSRKCVVVYANVDAKLYGIWYSLACSGLEFSIVTAMKNKIALHCGMHC